MRALVCLLIGVPLLACAEKAAPPPSAAPSQAAEETADESAGGAEKVAEKAAEEPPGDVDPADAGVAPAGEPASASGGGPAAGTTSTTPRRKRRAETPLERAVKDRVLAKLNDPAAFDEARLRRRIEAATGAKVARIRKGPMGLLQITFTPADPPRDEAAQRALVHALKELAELKFAEPERVLEAKPKR